MLEQLLDNNQTTVKVVFKHFPLRMHKQAMSAAYASVAADKQDKFWEYHNELFANSSRLNQPDVFIEIAKKLNLNLDMFLKDMGDQNTKNSVNKDVNDGKKAGVSGIPAVFINGKRLKRHNISQAQKIVDGELEKNN